MTPVLGPVLRPFDMEGIVEDHDNHHRLGRSGKNLFVSSLAPLSSIIDPETTVDMTDD